MPQTLTKKEILEYFSISEATLNNWVKNSVGHAVKNERYDLGIIKDFVSHHKKLETRANKKKSKAWTPPSSLLNYLKKTDWVDSWIHYVSTHTHTSLKENLIKVMRCLVNHKPVPDDLLDIYNLIPSPYEDIYAFGVAYQCLQNEGSKSETGSFYTPKEIAFDLVKDVVIEGGKVLEPCCGCGFIVLEYLIQYHQKFKNYPSGLVYINDIDSTAVALTVLTCQALCGDDFLIHSSSQDGLSLPYAQQMDIVLTNPPYGIKNDYSLLKTKEIFSHFVHKITHTYLRPKGLTRLVLPESFLAIECHGEIRKYLLKNHKINKINHYGQAFSSVASHIVVIELVQGKTSRHRIHFTENGEKKINVILSSTAENKRCIFSSMDKKEQDWICSAYQHPHITLMNASFSLGIVTGNNKHFVSSVPSVSSKKSISELILSGKNIDAGKINSIPTQYIDSIDYSSYQQKPPIDFFTGQKIIYRFISKRLITAVDNANHKTLNSANLIKLNDSPVSVEYVSAILNSEIINTIYQQKFGRPLKVLKGALQSLPIFIFEKNKIVLIEKNYRLGKHAENDKIIKEALEQFSNQPKSG